LLFNINEIEQSDYTFISNARVISLIKLALKQVDNILENINDYPIDIFTIDLKNAYDFLGEIIGETYKEDLLDELFSKFCLGK
jgi:tRNA modification GTPase